MAEIEIVTIPDLPAAGSLTGAELTIVVQGGVTKRSTLQADSEFALTLIDSGIVTGALGFTPYDAANPSAYITISALSTYATQSYVNSQGFLTNITGKLSAGTNVTVTGSGTTGSPYVINASGGGGGSLELPLYEIPIGAGTGNPVTSSSDFIKDTTGVLIKSAEFAVKNSSNENVFSVNQSSWVRIGHDGVENSDNAQVRINNKIDQTITFDGSGFVDFTRLEKTVSDVINYQSIGAFHGAGIAATGTDWNDVTGFLHGPELRGNFNFARILGYFDQPRLGGTSATGQRVGVFIADVGLTETATLGENLGIYIRPLVLGTTKKAIYIEGDNLFQTRGLLTIEDKRADVKTSKIDRLILASPDDGDNNVYTRLMFQSGGQAVVRLEGGMDALAPNPGNQSFGVLNVKCMINTFGGTGQANTTNLFSFYGDGRFVFNTVKGGIQYKSGANARAGDATLSGGTVTVANTSITANTRVRAFSQSDGGTPGWLRASLIVGTSFTITSSSVLDTSLITWVLYELN